MRMLPWTGSNTADSLGESYNLTGLSETLTPHGGGGLRCTFTYTHIPVPGKLGCSLKYEDRAIVELLLSFSEEN